MRRFFARPGAAEYIHPILGASRCESFPQPLARILSRRPRLSSFTEEGHARGQWCSSGGTDSGDRAATASHVVKAGMAARFHPGGHGTELT